jgi:hypothetical protein
MSTELDLDAIKRSLTIYATASTADQYALIAEVERLRSDNKETDGTDYAHPSYWRGSDAAFATMCEQLRKILDGEDDCKGKCQEPWDTLRRRVLALRQENADYEIAFGQQATRIANLYVELATAKRVGDAEEKDFAHWWLTRAERLSRLENPCRSKNIAICLASAYRQGKQSIAAELRAEVGG